jgi:hypothetical protein
MHHRQPDANVAAMVDAVEKASVELSTRNDRILTSDIENRYCRFDADLESMLLAKA